MTTQQTPAHRTCADDLCVPAARQAGPTRLLRAAHRGQRHPRTARHLGNHALLPRPWEPATCDDPGLRHELWQWLDAVVIWLNHDYTWDAQQGGMIPACWPQHPHLVHEIAVLADQRRRAGLAMTSDPLEEWHRYCLPSFTDRMRARLRSHCEEDHTSWPARPRHNEHTSQPQTRRREDAFADDVNALPERQRATAKPPRRATARRGGPRNRGTARPRRALSTHPYPEGTTHLIATEERAAAILACPSRRQAADRTRRLNATRPRRCPRPTQRVLQPSRPCPGLGRCRPPRRRRRPELGHPRRRSGPRRRSPTPSRAARRSAKPAPSSLDAGRRHL